MRPTAGQSTCPGARGCKRTFHAALLDGTVPPDMVPFAQTTALPKRKGLFTYDADRRFLEDVLGHQHLLQAAARRLGL